MPVGVLDPLWLLDLGFVEDLGLALEPDFELGGDEPPELAPEPNGSCSAPLNVTELCGGADCTVSSSCAGGSVPFGGAAFTGGTLTGPGGALFE